MRLSLRRIDLIPSKLQRKKLNLSGQKLAKSLNRKKTKI